MAERRMFTKKVTDDDSFMSLSASAQALYLHLSMSADDDGFCNQVSISMFKAHASIQDLEALLQNRYIYQFENGVIVIKDWRMANALRKDRYTPTIFQEEMAKLSLNDNGQYEWLPSGCQVVAECLPQDRLGKDRLDKVSIEDKKKTPKGVKEKEPTINDLLDESNLSDPVKDSVKEWVAYKKEQHRFTYKPIGFKKLLTEIINQEQAIGSVKVINAMNLSMAKGYQGIIWDLVKDSKGNSYMDSLKNRVSEVDDWI